MGETDLDFATCGQTLQSLGQLVTEAAGEANRSDHSEGIVKEFFSWD